MESFQREAHGEVEGKSSPQARKVGKEERREETTRERRGRSERAALRETEALKGEISREE